MPSKYLDQKENQHFEITLNLWSEMVGKALCHYKTPLLLYPSPDTIEGSEYRTMTVISDVKKAPHNFGQNFQFLETARSTFLHG